MRIDLGNPNACEHPGSSPSKPSTALERKPNTELLSISSLDGVFRVRLVAGDLRAIDTDKLRSEIAHLHRPNNPPAVVFSARGMESLSSGCLGAFAELSADLERVGGALVLYNLPKEIAKVLRKTKLDRLIQTAKDRPQAIKKALAMKNKHRESVFARAA